MWFSVYGLLFLVFAGYFLAILAPYLVTNFKHHAGKLIAILPAALTIFFISQTPIIIEKQTIHSTLPWASQLGVTLSFCLDDLSNLFAVIICFIGTLIFIYAGEYFKAGTDAGRFFSLLLTFMASMLGVVLANNIITLFVFWELTSLSSFLLIGFYNDREQSRKSALQGLLVTSMGGACHARRILTCGHRGKFL